MSTQAEPLVTVDGADRKPESDDAFRAELTALIPALRAFARTLCGNATAGDDLAQETLLKAWSARDSFEMGTNMKAWTFMILRNLFFSERRRSWRHSQLDQDVAERTLVAVDDPAAPVAPVEPVFPMGPCAPVFPIGPCAPVLPWIPWGP